MGGYLSCNKTSIEDAPDELILKKFNKPLTTKEIKRRTEEDMTREFDALYRRSRDVLASMTVNPCEHLTRRIQMCLDHNSDMTNCFPQMEEYQHCVFEKRSKYLEEKFNSIPVPCPPKKFE